MKTKTPPSLNVPCAGCKRLRRRCTADCIFVPYFPAVEPEKFAAVHRVFGASNVTKMLREIPVNHRGDAVTSLVYEAQARHKDPVYGCVSAIVALQQQVTQLQTELAMARAENASLRAQLGQALAAVSVTSKASEDTCDVSNILFDDCYSQGTVVSLSHLHWSDLGAA